jgi:hypothetical protein
MDQVNIAESISNLEGYFELAGGHWVNGNEAGEFEYQLPGGTKYLAVKFQMDPSDDRMKVFVGDFREGSSGKVEIFAFPFAPDV